MPAFDPVRDAVMNSPICQTAPVLPFPSPTSTLPSPIASPSLGGRRATDLSVLLNSVTSEPSLRTPPTRASTLSHLLHSDNDSSADDKLEAHQPLTRSAVDSRGSKSFFYSSPSPTRERESPVICSRPSSSSSASMPFSNQLSITTTRINQSNPSMPPPPMPPQSAVLPAHSSIPYNPRVRITPPAAVMIPLSPEEMETYKNKRYKGRGSTQILQGTKRKRSEECDPDIVQPPLKKLTGDVGVVVDHCMSSLFYLLFDRYR